MGLKLLVSSLVLTGCVALNVHAQDSSVLPHDGLLLAAANTSTLELEDGTKRGAHPNARANRGNQADGKKHPNARINRGNQADGKKHPNARINRGNQDDELKQHPNARINRGNQNQQ